MRILILFSTVLLSTIQPVTSEERKASEKAIAPATLDSAPVMPDQTAELLDLDLDYLVNGRWKILSIVADKPCDVNGDGSETTDILSETPICASDDVMKINANHTLSFERHQRCVPTESAIESYKWTLDQDGTFIIHDGSIQAKMILKSVSASRLILLIPMEEDGEMFHFKVIYGQMVKNLPGKALKN